MPLILGIDFETSGLDPLKDRPIELGSVLWDWDTKMPLMLLSELIDPSMDMGGFTVTEEITGITGITSEMLTSYGQYEKDVYNRLKMMAQFADYFMGHFCNDFDALFLSEMRKRQGDESDMLQKHWLDTSIDIKWPEEITTRKLRYLASEHSFLNPFSHRAVFDVLTMLKTASEYPLEQIIARSNEPMVYLEALVTFDEKERAKERGYRWNPPTKQWWKGFKESDALIERQECQFKTLVLPGKPVEQ